jgi:hypothetical protein
MVNLSEKNWDRLLDVYEKLVSEEDSITDKILELQRCI